MNYYSWINLFNPPVIRIIMPPLQMRKPRHRLSSFPKVTGTELGLEQIPQLMFLTTEPNNYRF